jgi:hypothetical protein
MDEGSPRQGISRVRIVPFREETVAIIADAIGASAALAPFQLPGAAVYQFTVEGSVGRPAAMVTLWPSLRRVDVIGSGAAVVFTRVASVQLVDGVEALFRRESGEFLVVAKGGRFVVRS